eukprot:Gregarina_sp_Poly_1__8803@NODE_528_length_7666_cov_26_468351_g418_i0_p6_GENE_NODE_528_length_7666_cov_26_468351_g418_i0NODE_528_length_7666_cov_26_468351_g418_i0_p6_ORF_typecomplete_len149_score21_91_NODE_528_length_7666_cov_26_468351_g418_i067337179
MGSSMESTPFGVRVKKRRQIAAEKLDGPLSSSKKRKIVKAAESTQKRPLKAFDRECGVLYNELLHGIKKESNPTKVGELFSLLSSEKSPLRTTEASSDPIQTINAFSRPSISRALQLLLKMGDENIRQWVWDTVQGMQANRERLRPFL